MLPLEEMLWMKWREYSHTAQHGTDKYTKTYTHITQLSQHSTLPPTLAVIWLDSSLLTYSISQGCRGLIGRLLVWLLRQSMLAKDNKNVGKKKRKKKKDKPEHADTCTQTSPDKHDCTGPRTGTTPRLQDLHFGHITFLVGCFFFFTACFIIHSVKERKKNQITTFHWIKLFKGQTPLLRSMAFFNMCSTNSTRTRIGPHKSHWYRIYIYI